MSASDIEGLYPLLEESESRAGMLRDVVARAQGCLLGQLAGDSLGSLVEFQNEATIGRLYPDGVRDLADGGTYNTIAGQPTDDSEMALMLARSIARAGRYDPGAAAVAYAHWFDSNPFDYGGTTAQALRPAVGAQARGDNPASVAAVARLAASRESQANGALMRASPLGIFAHALPVAAAADLARKDAALTHPHLVCQDANAVFVVAIAHAVAAGSDPEQTYSFVIDWAGEIGDEETGKESDWASSGAASGVTSEAAAVESGRPVHPAVRERLRLAASSLPSDFINQQGWVLTAFQNAFWQLLHAPSLEAGVCDTVMRGGDTDTNAAIAGALLGAVHGIAAIPAQWREAILSCRPEKWRPDVHQPRPRPFWPMDALLLARRLAELGSV